MRAAAAAQAGECVAPRRGGAAHGGRRFCCAPRVKRGRGERKSTHAVLRAHLLQPPPRCFFTTAASPHCSLALARSSLPQNLKVAKVSNGAASKLAKISVVRKQIARVLTVISQKTRAEMRAQVKNDAKKVRWASGAARRRRPAAPPSCPYAARSLPPSPSLIARPLRAHHAGTEAAAREEDARDPPEVDAGAGEFHAAERAGPAALFLSALNASGAGSLRAHAAAAAGYTLSPPPLLARLPLLPRTQSSKLTAKAAQKKAAFPPRKFTLRA